jgi:hypothetical protein
MTLVAMKKVWGLYYSVRGAKVLDVFLENLVISLKINLE